MTYENMRGKTHTNTPYDVIVVGARCTGAPLAMLLARAGHRVLVLDGAVFPSDTLSTHWVLAPGVRLLREWGLLDAVVASGCPPVDRVWLDAEGLVLSGAPDTVTYAPRRYVLDALLVDAARAAGAEVREGVAVRDLLWSEGRVTGVTGRDVRGRQVWFEARMVVGADGRNSTVARRAVAEPTADLGALAATAYGYWADVPVCGAEIRIREGLGLSMWPTHDGLTTVAATLPRSVYGRGGAREAFAGALARVPEVRDRLAAGRAVGAVQGAQNLRNYFRRAWGPGWALAGDAGHHKDPIGARGISDAFTDAAGLFRALDDVLTGRLPEERALERFRARRDTGRAAAFAFVCRQAELGPLDGPFLARLKEAAGDPVATRELLGVFTGEQRLERYLSGARDSGAVSAG
ncbi:NAD(P)/FAD-dependent oxidoreductase [Streptomyces sp. NPDC046870]|uniref:NAD(P)/FAD-dependent oxidoreductase n=1 Tax=Streptomyces sp. NPDC046870 TaxID=3155135 RepID=UPI003451BC4C